VALPAGILGGRIVPGTLTAAVDASGARSALGATVEGLSLPDGRLHEHRAALADGIASAIRRLRPEAVFAPWVGDGHRDHRAVAFALADALGRSPVDVQVWGYETWAAVPHNRLVPIEAAIDRKEASIAVHETASLAFDLASGLGLSRWRAMHGLLGEGHGEAFLATDREGYLDLSSRLGDFDDAHPAAAP